jgi:hypothetical protein
MQPLSLTLKGFRGIRDGLGRDVLKLDFERLADGAELVAIAGANGRGKTTVMDNMHPYLTMPSRAAMAGPGGFSYYDHVCLPENEKDLIWAHDGRSYRSQVVIRVNGRRKTEAFLLMLADDGAWKPVVLDDGTVSDGKVDTYTRCVEALCGSADTFFTSVFSAQGKRQLSAYRNAEIKTLLADLLGQEEIRALGQQAGETARLLKAGLAAIRQEQAERSRWSALQDRRCKYLDALKQAAAVRRAERRLPLAEIVLAARAARVTTWRRQVQCLTECQGAVRTAEQKLAATLREAGQAAIRADDLARRFGLTNAVPCAGTDLQGQCQLLGDAREASTLIPSAQAAMARLAREKASIDAELATLRSQREALSGAPMTLSRVEVKCGAKSAMGNWNLFARCMSNDGLIALAIDDAGPTLSGLANDLLLACYGPASRCPSTPCWRPAKGEQKEGFDIVVHDGESGESKSVSLMSGGETGLVNECLTRAVALYLAQHTGRRYTTLFSDEADGAAGPRAQAHVHGDEAGGAALGGYEREFFVSQTPELTAMADAVIDLVGRLARALALTVHAAKRHAAVAATEPVQVAQRAQRHAVASTKGAGRWGSRRHGGPFCGWKGPAAPTGLTGPSGLNTARRVDLVHDLRSVPVRRS